MDRKPKTVYQLDSPFTNVQWFVKAYNAFQRQDRLTGV
jgi:hypothetical protein